MSLQSDSYKKELIFKHIFPALGIDKNAPKQKAEDIFINWKLKDMVKGQRLESPGFANEGIVSFSMSSQTHSYQHNAQNAVRYGTKIWAARSFIFLGSSLRNGAPRTEFIELLEASEVLQISYPALNFLIEKYKEISEAIDLMVLKQMEYTDNRNLMLTMNPADRIERLKAQHPAFFNCSNQEQQAIHVRMSVRTYQNKLKMLKIKNSGDYSKSMQY
jgi:CRP-like cAMP-binding protein